MSKKQAIEALCAYKKNLFSNGVYDQSIPYYKKWKKMGEIYRYSIYYISS